MVRKTCILALALFVCLGVAGCSLTYYQSGTKRGFQRTEFGLLGGPGGHDVPGLIPLYRSNVELQKEEKE